MHMLCNIFRLVCRDQKALEMMKKSRIPRIYRPDIWHMQEREMQRPSQGR